MEWIEGWSVREVLGGGQEGDELPDEDGEEEEEEPDDVQEMLKGLGVDHGAFSHPLRSCRALDEPPCSLTSIR